MNIFDLNYHFKALNFDLVDGHEDKVRIDVNRFILHNQTDAFVRVTITSPCGGKIVTLTELAPGFGYLNDGASAIRYTLPQGTVIKYNVIGGGATEGKLMITLAQ